MFDNFEVAFRGQRTNDDSKSLRIFALLHVVTSSHDKLRVHRLRIFHAVNVDIEEQPFLALDTHGNVEERLVVMSDKDAYAVFGVLAALNRPTKNIRLSSVLGQLSNLNVYVIQLMQLIGNDI